MIQSPFLCKVAHYYDLSLKKDINCGVNIGLAPVLMSIAKIILVMTFILRHLQQASTYRGLITPIPSRFASFCRPKW